MLTREQIEKWHTMVEEAIDAGYLDEDLANEVAEALGATEEPYAWSIEYESAGAPVRWLRWENAISEFADYHKAKAIPLFAHPAPILDAKTNNGLAPLLKNSYEAGFLACREEATKVCEEEFEEAALTAGEIEVCGHLASQIRSLDPDAKRPT